MKVLFFARGRRGHDFLILMNRRLKVHSLSFYPASPRKTPPAKSAMNTNAKNPQIKNILRRPKTACQMPPTMAVRPLPMSAPKMTYIISKRCSSPLNRAPPRGSCLAASSKVVTKNVTADIRPLRNKPTKISATPRQRTFVCENKMRPHCGQFFKPVRPSQRHLKQKCSSGCAVTAV